MSDQMQVDPAIVIRKMGERCAILEQELALREAIIEQLQAQTEETQKANAVPAPGDI